MLNAKERREAAQILSAEGMHTDSINALFRLGTRLHRLAEAQCNGDWPADNGSGHANECPKCQTLWRTKLVSVEGYSTLVCPDCQAELQARAIVAKVPGFGLVLGGDPRGAVLLITTPNKRYNDWGQRGVVCG